MLVPPINKYKCNQAIRKLYVRFIHTGWIRDISLEFYLIGSESEGIRHEFYKLGYNLVIL
jgi:hypothetical protein